MIMSYSMYEKAYLQGSLRGVLEAIQVSSFYLYSHDLWMVGSLHQEEKRRNEIILIRLAWAPWVETQYKIIDI